MSPYHAGAAQVPPPVPGVHNAFHAGAPPVVPRPQRAEARMCTTYGAVSHHVQQGCAACQALLTL